MYALAGKSIQVSRERRNKRFTFTGFHFGNSALMQNNAAFNLNGKVLHIQHTPACLTANGKRFGKKVVKGFTVGKTLFKFIRLCAKLGIGKSGVLLLIA